jgi:hypothetical protein
LPFDGDFAAIDQLSLSDALAARAARRSKHCRTLLLGFAEGTWTRAILGEWMPHLSSTEKFRELEYPR